MKTLGKLIKELDILIGKYMKLTAPRDDMGRIQCFINKTWHYPDNIEVCHFIQRDKMCTRFHPDNLRLGSKTTNRFEEDHIEKFKEMLISDIGLERVENLYNLASDRCTPNRISLNKDIELYEERIKYFRTT